MGVVYKAHDLKLDRHVALKFLPPHLLKSPDDVERFQQEAKALSTLNHPNIAIIHDIEQPEGLKFLDLEFLPGGTLRKRLQDLQASGASFSFPQILGYASEILEGLGHAHRRGIIHRDVKTDNMMLTEEGLLKITDFGLAKFKDKPTLEEKQSTVGTFGYMSPEQIRGEELDQRSDLFSFGVVLFELMTGQFPFRGEHEAALGYSILNESPASLRALRPDATESLEKIVMKCLEKDKQWRYQSAEDVLKDLKQFRRELEGSPISRISFSKQWIVTWVLAIALSVLVFVLVREKPSGRGQESVAVLPFLNLSDSKEDEYFSQGITEDIITQLSKISSLKVVSFALPAGSGQMKKDLEAVRKNAGVNIVLKGSVRTSGLRVRITAQLLDLQSNSALWAETYERELKDIFNVQTEVARQIGLALESKLSLQTHTKAVDKGDEDIETYRLYLQGRYFWNKRTPDGVRKALEYFQLAIARDETYARGYAGLADCYVVLASNTFAPPNEVMPKAKAAAQKALSLNSSLAEAHASLGMVAFWYEWDSRQAEREFKQALALNPNYATARQWYAWYLAALGRSDEAIQEIQKALTLEPLSLVINTEVGAIHYFTGKYEGEVDPYKRALEMDPDFALARLHLGFAYLADERYDDAIQELESAVRLSDSNPTMVAALGNGYAQAGKKNLAEKILAMLRELSKSRYVSPAHLAGLCSALGRNEEAFAYLTKAMEERSASLVWMKMGRGFNALRSDPRFVKLLNAVTLER